MIKLSEESRFIAENLRLVNDVIKAKTGLQKELNSILSAVGDRLKQKNWFDSEWKIRDLPRESGFYITHTNWYIEGKDGIWIAMSGFSADNLFDGDQLINLYVWVYYPEKEQLSAKAKENFRTKFNSSLIADLQDCDQVGNTSDNNGWYAISRELIASNLKPEQDIGEFLQQITNEIFDFIDHYVRLLIKLGIQQTTLTEMFDALNFEA